MERVTIVGGGVVGLTTAFVLNHHVLSNGKKLEIQVIEREENLGSKSTTAAGCGLRTVYRHPTNLELARKGLQFWRNADSILGGEIGFRENGYLFLTDSESTEDTLNNQMNRQVSYGIPAEIESPPSRRANTPPINTSNYSTSLFSPKSALASPEMIVDTISTTLKDSNVKVSKSREVVGLQRDEDSVLVETTDGNLSSDYVINACGAWSNRLAEMVGSNLPVTNVRRRLCALDLETSAECPLIVDIDTGIYMLPRQDGQVIAGGHLVEADDSYSENDEESFTDKMDESWERAFRQHSKELWSELSKARITDTWTGMYTLTESRVPIVDKDGRIIHATGFSGHGIMQAPAVGMLVARMLSERNSHTDMFGSLSRTRRELEPDIQF